LKVRIDLFVETIEQRKGRERERRNGLHIEINQRIEGR